MSRLHSDGIDERVQRFQRDEFPARRRFFQELALGQKPRALFITCSDSRISPHMVTGSQPGDLFVIRNAGNIVPSSGQEIGGGEAATIEFGVKGLGIPRIIVCGHSLCGAMGALLDPGSAAPMPRILEWVRHAAPALERTPEGPDRYDRLAQQNVLLQLENLRSYEFVREAEQAGRLELSGWMYRFQDGEVFSYDAARAAFLPLAARAVEVKPH